MSEHALSFIWVKCVALTDQKYSADLMNEILLEFKLTQFFITSKLSSMAYWGWDSLMNKMGWIALSMHE